MADYYTRFSFVIALHGDTSWVDELWPLLDSATTDTDTGSEHPIFGPDEAFGLPDVEHTDDGLWFCDDGGCSDISTTIDLVQWVLAHPGTPATVEFSWAETCSKPRPDAYGGGTALVSRYAAATVRTSSPSVEELLAADLARQHADGH